LNTWKKEGPMANVEIPDFDAWLKTEVLTGRSFMEASLVEVCGGRVWWMRVGDSGGTPLLVLHGGPGSGHDSLLPLAALADERPVIFYDQLGCGKADSPNDPRLYTVERSVAELVALREALGLKSVDLFGHSWGSILALEYLCQTGDASVRRLVLSGAIASIPQFARGAQRLLADITAELRTFGRPHSPEDIEAVFYERHFCRTKPLPPYVARSSENLRKSIAYRLMNGPNEFTITGVIREWDRRASLKRIKQPTLVTTGQYDEVTPDVIDDVVDGIKNCSRYILPGCSHSTAGEDPLTLINVVRSFLH
jgi:proline-specific peptidase